MANHRSRVDENQ